MTLTKMTIAQLREIISTLNETRGLYIPEIKVPSKAKKAEIVALVQERIDMDYDNALAEDEARYAAEIRDAEEKARDLEHPDSFIVKALTFAQRVENYKKQNGVNKLTRRQQQRIKKKFAKAIKRGSDIRTEMGE